MDLSMEVMARKAALAMTDLRKAHQHFLVTVLQGKHTDNFVYISSTEVVRKEIIVISGMFPNVQNSNLQQDAGSERHILTKLYLQMTRNMQQLLRFTFQRMMNARCNYRKYSRMSRPNTE